MPSVLAVFAHPDDIEFVAAGTLIRLHDLGWEIHYMNLANGCCGSTTTNREETARIRELESQAASNLLQASFHPPISADLEVNYDQVSLAKVAAVVRIAKPSIILTHAPLDYMEDHMQTCRLVVSAAFAKGVPNYPTDPSVPAWDGDTAIYHAQPHGNRTPMGELIVPGLSIDIDSVIDRKLEMLQQHRSQQAWLQASQGLNSYCQTMLDLGKELAQIGSMKCTYAEGWRRHHHLGFSSVPFDPLAEIFRNN